MTARLLYRDGAGRGCSVDLAPSVPVLLGRSPEAHVRLDDDGVADRPARVFFADGRYWVERSSPDSGVYVNELPIEKAVDLVHLDLIRTGPLLVRYVEAGRRDEVNPNAAAGRAPGCTQVVLPSSLFALQEERDFALEKLRRNEEKYRRLADEWKAEHEARLRLEQASTAAQGAAGEQAAELAAARERNRELGAALRELEARLREARAKVAEEAPRSDGLSQENAALGAEVATLRRERDAFEADLRSVRQEHEAAVAALSVARTRLEESQGHYQRRLDGLLGMMEGHDERDLRQVIAAQQLDLREVSTDVGHARGESELLRTENDRLEAALGEARSEGDILRESLRAIARAIDPSRDMTQIEGAKALAGRTQAEALQALEALREAQQRRDQLERVAASLRAALEAGAPPPDAASLLDEVPIILRDVVALLREALASPERDGPPPVPSATAWIEQHHDLQEALGKLNSAIRILAGRS